MKENKFYDIHCHAMNLSHPNLLAFLNRFFNLRSLLLNRLRPLGSILIGKNLLKIKNLLSVMENDLGDFFLIMENCLKDPDNPLLQGALFRVGDRDYGKVVLTPLVIDFGTKGGRDPDIHYSQLSEKPVVEQVIDLFNGIRRYREKSREKIFEIFPFLGLNTRNYFLEAKKEGPRDSSHLAAEETKNTLPNLLEKYFGDYQASPAALLTRMGEFDGNMEQMTSNFFAGIKLYPPLGFDPWPEKNGEELEKVRYLYEFCSGKKIPLTVHCCDQGFVTIPDREVKAFTNPSKWEPVLKRYPALKINLAHFGKQGKRLGIFRQTNWQKTILKLMAEYENVYTDFANNGLDDQSYRSLRALIEASARRFSPGFKEKLTRRILFGSDFMINLLRMDSYNQYLGLFSGTKWLTPEEKELFGCLNPERFLFSDHL